MSDASIAFAPTPVVFAYLFGSRAKGRARADSDTDVGVVLARGTPVNAALLGDLTMRLEDAGFVRPDVHVLTDAPLALQWEATRGERLWARDDGARARYEAWVTLRYLDFEPLLRLQYRIQRERIAQRGTLGPARAR